MRADALRKLKAITVQEATRKLVMAEARDACRKSQDPAHQKALRMAEAGYGFAAVALGSGCSDILARRLTRGE